MRRRRNPVVPLVALVELDEGVSLASQEGREVVEETLRSLLGDGYGPVRRLLKVEDLSGYAVAGQLSAAYEDYVSRYATEWVTQAWDNLVEARGTAPFNEQDLEEEFLFNVVGHDELAAAADEIGVGLVIQSTQNPQAADDYGIGIRQNFPENAEHMAAYALLMDVVEVIEAEGGY